MIKKNENVKVFDKTKRLVFNTLILLFLVCIIFRITTHIKFEGRGWSTYFPYILYIAIFTIRLNLSWFLGFIYSIYGLYYYLFVLNEYPTYTEFTLPIVELFYGDGGGFSNESPFVHFLLLLPFIFYLGYTISYLIIIAFKFFRYIKKNRI